MTGPARTFINGRIHGRFKFRRAVRISPPGSIIGMGTVINDFRPDTDGHSSGKRQEQAIAERHIRIDRPFTALLSQLIRIRFMGDGF